MRVRPRGFDRGRQTLNLSTERGRSGTFSEHTGVNKLREHVVFPCYFTSRVLSESPGWICLIGPATRPQQTHCSASVLGAS